jgi:hypothetical protein
LASGWNCVFDVSDVSVQKEILGYDDDSFFVYELEIYIVFSTGLWL